VGTITVELGGDFPGFIATTTGYTSPETIYKYDLAASKGNRWTVIWKPDIKNFKPEEFVTEQVRICICVILQFLTEMAVQVWYQSKDGTEVPMFIVRLKDTPRDGSAPAVQIGLCTDTRSTLRFTCCCLGYGGFANRVKPSFDLSILITIKVYGIISAVPAIRLVNLLCP